MHHQLLDGLEHRRPQLLPATVEAQLLVGVPPGAGDDAVRSRLGAGLAGGHRRLLDGTPAVGQGQDGEPPDGPVARHAGDGRSAGGQEGAVGLAVLALHADLVVLDGNRRSEPHAVDAEGHGDLGIRVARPVQGGVTGREREGADLGAVQRTGHLGRLGVVDHLGLHGGYRDQAQAHPQHCRHRAGGKQTSEPSRTHQ